MEVIVHEGDRPSIEVRYYDVTPGNHESWTVPIGAIAAHSELLGYADPMESFEAVVYILKHGMPNVDPETGRGIFVDAFTLLAHREKSREDEARAAIDEADDQVLGRSSVAAFNAVHQPINDGECAMDRCRRSVRKAIGLPDPSRKCGEESRTREPEVKVAPMSVSTFSINSAQSEEDEFHQKVSTALAPLTGDIARATREFLHELTGSPDDPLAEHLPEVTPPPEPEPEPEPDMVLLTADELLAQYQEGQP